MPVNNWWVKKHSGRSDLLNKKTHGYYHRYPGFGGVFVFYLFKNQDSVNGHFFNLYYTQSGVHRTVDKYADSIIFPAEINLNDMKDMTSYMDYYMDQPRNHSFSIKLYKYSTSTIDFDIVMNRDLKWAILNSRHKFRNYRWLSQVLINGKYVINDK